MSNENSRKTWAQPWLYREGTMVTAAILLVGFVGDNLVAFHNPFSGWLAIDQILASICRNVRNRDFAVVVNRIVLVLFRKTHFGYMVVIQ